MRPLVKLLRLSGAEQYLLIEAAIWLCIVWLAIVALPFRWIALYLGQRMAESPEAAEPKDRDLVKRVSWAVRTASRHLPGKSKCLTRAIAMKRMLKRRGVRSTLYLGVGKDGEERLCAHAWLRSADVIASGARGTESFTVISTFAERG